MQLSIKYSKFFIAAIIVNICFCEGDFHNSYFLQRAFPFGVLNWALISLWDIAVFVNRYFREYIFWVSHFCKGNIFFFKVPLSVVHSLNLWLILFEKRSCGRPSILSNVLAFLMDKLDSSIPSCRIFLHGAVAVIDSLEATVFIAMASCSYPFLQRLYGKDYFKQQLLIKNSYFFGRATLDIWSF